MFSFIAKLLRLCRPYRRRLVLGVVMGLLGGLLEPLLMLCVKVAVDVIFPGASETSSGLTAANFRDLPAISQRLSRHDDAVSQYLWDRLPPSMQQEVSAPIDQKAGFTNVDPNLADKLALEMNVITLDTNFYQEDRFAGVKVSTLTRHLLYERPEGADLVRMNQILLAEAYPGVVKVKLSFLEKHLRTRQYVRRLKQMLPQGGLSSHGLNVVMVILAIPLVMFLRGLVSYLNVYFLQWVSVRAITDLRMKLFTHLVNMPLGFLNKISTGELASRVISDTVAVQNSIGGSLLTLIKDPATLIGLLALLLWNEPFLTLVSMIVFPVCLVPIIVYAKKVRAASRMIQNQYAELQRIMHETFTGSRIVKAYNLEKHVGGLFRAASDKFVNHYMRAVRAGELPGPMIEFFGAIGVALLFYYMLIVSNRELDAGDFFMFVLSIFSMYRPIKSLSRIYSQMEQANAASERVFQLLEMTTTLPEPANPRPVKAAGMDVQFDHVNFNYDSRPVLRDFSLTVKAGQMVALVGETGSGKTTVTSLLLRFYDPQKGAVRIGGMDIREATTADLRNQIAVVTQDTLLFDETIRRNIELGRPGATENEIIAAAKHAHAHEFIMEKENGYDTMVGEKGVALSGGQKQRLAIARAILKNAPILILDEATSSLDTRTERAVQAQLDELMQNRTTLCIAHRLSTIQNADIIVVLDEGKIVEIGRHEELYKQNGAYRRLYESREQPTSKEDSQ